MKSAPSSERVAARVIAEGALAASGIALVLCALWVDQAWLDRHFLPILFVSHRAYVLGETLARVAVAVLGAALVLGVGPLVGRIVARTPPGVLAADMARIALAVVLALGASELVLRGTFPRTREAPPPDEEPLQQPDQRLGWLFVPGHHGRASFSGRIIDYAFDAAGYRVRRVEEPVDPELPTILFAGESIVAGYGLRWEESVPAQVEAMLGMQAANLAVFGYANDQAYLRLAAELPRFRRPVAVVSLFMPALFDRNLDDGRPHLGPELSWLPPVHRWRLRALVQYLVPYRSDAEIERGIEGTRAVLQATIDLARARHAVPLIIVPQFGQETPIEGLLRRRILDEAALPYLSVELDPSWHLPGDSHPDSRAARAIAEAVAARLSER